MRKPASVTNPPDGRHRTEVADAGLNQHFRLEVERIEAQLHRVLPDILRDTLRVRLGFTFLNLIHSAAELHLLATTPFGNIHPDDATLFTHFVDYVEGTLSFPSRPS